MDVSKMTNSELLKYRLRLEMESLHCCGHPDTDGADISQNEIEQEIWGVVVPEMNSRGIKDMYQKVLSQCARRNGCL